MSVSNTLSPFGARYNTTADNANGTGKTGSGSAITNAAGGNLGKDEFVKLLITQMSNQDPLNPMDGKELATQLAQFSSVEQLININEKLDALTRVIKPTTVSQ